MYVSVKKVSIQSGIKIIDGAKKSQFTGWSAREHRFTAQEYAQGGDLKVIILLHKKSLAAVLPSQIFIPLCFVEAYD